MAYEAKTALKPTGLSEEQIAQHRGGVRETVWWRAMSDIWAFRQLGG